MKTPFLITFIITSIVASWSYSQPAMVIQNDFNKQLDQKKLEKLLLLNDSDAIISTIQNDLDLYKIEFENTSNAVTHIQQLIRRFPQSPVDMKSILGSLELTKVIGLFLPIEQLQIQSPAPRDALFIREDAGLWTLIHEYMHFLFNKDHRHKNMLSAPELKNAITDNTETYNEEVAHYKLYQKFETESRKYSYMEALQNLCKLNLQYVINFSIEEIVIEEQLQHKFRIDRENKIQFLESEEYSYSNIYISKNLRSALNTTEYMLRLIDESKRFLPQEDFTQIKDVLESYKSKYTEILLHLKKRNQPESKPAVQTQIVTA